MSRTVLLAAVLALAVSGCSPGGSKVGGAQPPPRPADAVAIELLSSSSAEDGPTLGQVVFRDKLIAAQETLLNAYRCRFGTDAFLVSGGCRDGRPVNAPMVPAKFEGAPVLSDLEVRDGLIAAQETLLNAYRCRHDYEIDIRTVPGGCPANAPAPTSGIGASEHYQDLGADSLPPALITPTGVSVAVLGRSGGGYLVRTPCGDTAEVVGGQPIFEAQVVLDPGHGGAYDVGAVGSNGLAERDLNLTLSRAVLEELSRRGIAAAATRTGHYGSPLPVRAAFADALSADALVSIHHNAPTSRITTTPGTEVFVQSASTQRIRADSARLGGLLHEEVTAALSTFDNISWSRSDSAGVLRVLLPDGRDAYGMIRRPTVPTALIEYGYLSNPSEAELFSTGQYILTAAKASANAIEAYLYTDRSGTAPVPQPRVFDPAPAPTRCNETALQ